MGAAVLNGLVDLTEPGLVQALAGPFPFSTRCTVDGSRSTRCTVPGSARPKFDTMHGAIRHDARPLAPCLTPTVLESYGEGEYQSHDDGKRPGGC
jgi:hypothetical protein